MICQSQWNATLPLAVPSHLASSRLKFNGLRIAESSTYVLYKTHPVSVLSVMLHLLFGGPQRCSACRGTHAEALKERRRGTEGQQEEAHGVRRRMIEELLR